MLNSNSNDYNNFNLSKKKSLKTTLYRIFTQRKKSNFFFIIKLKFGHYKYLKKKKIWIF